MDVVLRKYLVIQTYSETQKLFAQRKRRFKLIHDMPAHRANQTEYFDTFFHVDPKALNLHKHLVGGFNPSEKY